jgi:hypothetical protein
VQGQLFVRCCGERVDFQTAGRVVLLRRASLFFGDGHERRYSTMLLLLSANHSILQHPLVRAQAAGKKHCMAGVSTIRHRFLVLSPHKNKKITNASMWS